MKQIRLSFNIISIISLLALTVGCATTSSTQNKESMLVASGFKVITPKTAAQQQKLQQLPPGKVAMINVPRCRDAVGGMGRLGYGLGTDGNGSRGRAV